MKLSSIAYEIQKEQVDTVQPIANPAIPVTADISTQKLTKEQKQKLHGLVKDYNKYGTYLSTDNKMSETAATLREIAKLTECYISEQKEGWFEKNIVKRNMNDLNKRIEEFGKLAEEVDSSHRQLSALYSETGHILETYFDIEG